MLKKNETGNMKDIEVVFKPLSRKFEILRDEIAELKNDIEKRAVLHTRLVSELEDELRSRRFDLGHLPPYNQAQHGSLHERRRSLEKDIAGLERAKQEENLVFWRDRVKVQDELRKLLREYRTLKKRREFLLSRIGCDR